MKECDKCGEEIKENALKCPKCKSWQGRIGQFRRYSYIGLGLMIYGIIVVSPRYFNGSWGYFLLIWGGLMSTFYGARKWWRKRKIKQREVVDEDSDS